MIPSKVKVGGVHYDIEMIEDDINCGTCSPDSLLIRVDPRLKEEKQRDIFIHELTHAIFHESGIKLDDEIEEDYVNRISKVLNQVLTDNEFNFGGKLRFDGIDHLVYTGGE